MFLYVAALRLLRLNFLFRSRHKAVLTLWSGSYTKNTCSGFGEEHSSAKIPCFGRHDHGMRQSNILWKTACFVCYYMDTNVWMSPENHPVLAQQNTFFRYLFFTWIFPFFCYFSHFLLNIVLFTLQLLLVALQITCCIKANIAHI